MSQPFDKPEQPKLIPGRRSMIQIAERIPLQQFQSKIRAKVSVPESFMLEKCSGHHDKVFPVSNYQIPQTMSEHDSISRTIRRKGIQDTIRKIPAYANPIHRPPSKANEIPLQEIPRKLMDLDIDALEPDINMEFEENSLYQEGVISEMYKGQISHISKNHQNCKV